MKKMFNKLFSRNKIKVLNEKELELKAKKGIDFTIANYSETLKDLAKYDRGEKIAN